MECLLYSSSQNSGAEQIYLTDVEFIELRYSGKSAAFLRGFKSIYLGVFMNTIIMGWVNLAMMKILMGMFPEYINQNNVLIYVGLCMLLTAFYSALSGLWGVAVTDAFQFILAMAGCIILAIIVVNSEQIGGITGLQAKLPDWALRFTPEINSDSTAIFNSGSICNNDFIIPCIYCNSMVGIVVSRRRTRRRRIRRTKDDVCER